MDSTDMHGLVGARRVLERIKNKSIEKVWRTVLEGALMEARSGEIKLARKALKYLIAHVPWYGPLYQEALRLEEKADRPRAAIKIARLGLKETPRYGPLWFGAFRSSERLDVNSWNSLVSSYLSQLPRVETDHGNNKSLRAIDNEIRSISRDLLIDSGCYTAVLGETARPHASTS